MTYYCKLLKGAILTYYKSFQEKYFGSSFIYQPNICQRMKLWILYSLFLMGLLSAWPWHYVKRDSTEPVIQKEYFRQKCHLVSTGNFRSLEAASC
jgi:hypothetical protein